MNGGPHTCAALAVPGQRQHLRCQTIAGQLALLDHDGSAVFDEGECVHALVIVGGSWQRNENRGNPHRRDLGQGGSARATHNHVRRLHFPVHGEEERLDRAIRSLMGTGPEDYSPEQWRGLRAHARLPLLYAGLGAIGGVIGAAMAARTGEQQVRVPAATPGRVADWRDPLIFSGIMLALFVAILTLKLL